MPLKMYKIIAGIWLLSLATIIGYNCSLENYKNKIKEENANVVSALVNNAKKLDSGDRDVYGETSFNGIADREHLQRSVNKTQDRLTGIQSSEKLKKENGEKEKLDNAASGAEQSADIKFNISALFVDPYMDSPIEREYIRKIHALPMPVSSSNKSKKSVITFSLYGDDPKYVQGAIENAKLRDTYFPGWILRYYVLPTFSNDIIMKLREYGAEVVHPPQELCDDPKGMMFWRFLVADDEQVERFIIRDTDSRLNARDRFLVEEWIHSGKPCHVIRDHPYHYAIMNGGLWGANRGFLSKHTNSTMMELISAFREKKSNCRRLWGCDNKFLEFVIWPFIQNDHIAFDNYYCKQYPNAVGLPTPRDTNYQFVGQSFDRDGKPAQEHLEKIKSEPAVTECVERTTDNSSDRFVAL